MENNVEIDLTSKEFIVFELSNEYYCVEIQKIERIIAYPHSIRKVPNLPTFIKGIFDFEEKIVPILDLKDFMEIKPHLPLPKEQYIVLFELNFHLLGIIVDNIFETQKITNLVKKDSSHIPLKVKRFSEGTLRIKDDHFSKNGTSDEELVVILNPDKIYSSIETELINNGN